jgi:hypothetical protein
MTKPRATTVELISQIREKAPSSVDYGSRIALATRRVKSPPENDATDKVAWWTIYERLLRLGYDPVWMTERHPPNERRVVTTYNNVPEFDEITMAKTLDDDDSQKQLLDFEDGVPVNYTPDEDEESEGNDD